MRKINNSNKIKYLIIGGIILFFGIIFIFNLIKIGVFNQDSQKSTVLNNQVIFEQPKLRIFDDTRYINQFPDTIHFHYPYFIVVVPENSNQITTVYDLIQKKNIANLNEIVLDYANGDFLYNYHGGDTYFRNKNLGKHCLTGFIKNDKEVLCVIQDSNYLLQEHLISINPRNGSVNDLYSPSDAITAIYFNESTLYIGEYNYATHQPYITINGKKTKVNSYISIIYPLQNNMNVATLKNTENNLSGSYSEIVNSNNEEVIKLKGNGLIKFY